MKRGESQAIDGQMDFLILVQDHQLLLFNVIIGRLEQSAQRDQSHNFRSCDGHVETRGIAARLNPNET